MPSFLANMTLLARKMLESSPELVDGDATDFEMRTKAFTRPAYENKAKPAGTTSRLMSSTTGEDPFADTRPSPLPAGVFVKHRILVENEEKGVIAREERKQRDVVREEMRQAQYEETKGRRERGLETHKTTQEARRKVLEYNLEKGREERKKRAEHEIIIEKRVEKIKEEHLAMLQSTGGTSGRDARLDAQEEAEAAALREASVAEKLERRAYVAAKKKEISEANRAAVEALRMERAARLAKALAKRDRLKAAAAEELRTDSQRKLEVRAAEQAQHQAKSRETHEKVVRAREQSLQARAEHVKQKQLENPNNFEELRAQKLANQEEFLQENREKRNAIFGNRYVSQDDWGEFEESRFRKLQSRRAVWTHMDDKVDGVDLETNLKIVGRIEQAAPVVDDLIDDDAAGEARVTFAQASEERRLKERIDRLRANAAHRERLRNVEPQVDDLLDDDEAGARRKELADAGQARRQAEAKVTAKLAREMQERVANAQAVTDDVLDEEAAAEARQRAKAASAERRRAHVERIAHENAEMRQRIASTGARTDDDVTDEAAFAIRGKMAAQSRAQRKAAASQLTKANSQQRARVKAAKSSIDDDISDELAGSGRSQGSGWLYTRQ